MIKNFSQYLIEEEREVYFTFGRMNPPTIGHGKVMDTLAKKSGKSDYKVYLSQSQNPKKDPLSYTDKIKHTRKMFPKHARQVIMDKGVKNVFDVAAKLYDEGYTKVNMVVGADRIMEFETLLNKYNGVKARHGFYNFKKINVISAGERDPDATGVEGMSASKQRENASKNDFVTFAQGVPKSMSNADARKLFNDVRKGMGLKETREFKNHIELQPVSETREQYVQGDLYEIGDTVVIKETEECATVSMLGANYVIVERTDGTRLRKWLDAVELVERQDPDIKDRKGTQPARYHAGLKKSTKIARDAHFQKNAKKADDDKSAYEPAPGDATAKTKPSKYTKAFKDMYEEVSQRQLNDLEKFADRLLAKFDIDVEFTRHFADRMNDKRNNPAISIPELQRLFKKIAKEKGQNIKKHKNGEAVLKDIQSDLNLPVVVNFKNDEFEVVNKTIMRKKDFKTTSPVVKYESVSEAKVSVGDRVTLQPNKSVLDRSLIGKAGVVTGMLGRDVRVKFANDKTILVSPRDLKINESLDLDEAKGTGVKKFVKNMRVANIHNGKKGTVVKGGDNLKKQVEVEWDSGTTTMTSGKYLQSISKNESIEEDLNPRWLKDMIGSKLSPRKYKHALDVLTKIVDRKKKENNGKLRHAVIYYAAQVAKQYDGVDSRNLAAIYDKSVTEATDPVQTAKASIEREKETDKKKHDRILDRARLARARQKNQETK